MITRRQAIAALAASYGAETQEALKKVRETLGR